MYSQVINGKEKKRMSGVLMVERGSMMLCEFRHGHMTSLVSSQACCAGGDGRVGLGMVRVVVCNTRCGVWGIEWGMVPRVVSVWPWWGMRLGEVCVVRVIGPERWVQLCGR